jgi:hypothetical protein
MIGVIIFVVLDQCQSTISHARKVLMKAELRNLQAASRAYNLHYGVFPPDIRYIGMKVPNSGIISLVDKENYPIDPFGKRYIYDPANGKVYSQEMRMN